MNLRALFTRQTYPLHEAVYATDLERIKSLLENGADLNQVDGDGITAIELAITLAAGSPEKNRGYYDCISIFLDQPSHQLNPELLGNVLLYSLPIDSLAPKLKNEFINKLLMKDLLIDWTKDPGAKLLSKVSRYEHDYGYDSYVREYTTKAAYRCELQSYVREHNEEVGLFLLRSGVDSAYLPYRRDGSILEIFVRYKWWNGLLIFLNEIQKEEPAKLTRIEYLDRTLRKAIKKTGSTFASPSHSRRDDVIRALIKAKHVLIKAKRKDSTWKPDNALLSYRDSLVNKKNLLFYTSWDCIALMFAYDGFTYDDYVITTSATNFFLSFDYWRHQWGQSHQIIQLVDAFFIARYVIMSLHHHAQNKMGVQPDNAYSTLLPPELRIIIEQLAFQEILEKFSLSKPNEFLTNYLEIIKEEESLMEEAKEEARLARLTEVFKIIYPTIIAYRSTRKINFLADKKDKTSSQLIADIEKEIMSHPQGNVKTAWSLAKKYKNNYLQNNQMNVDLFLEILLYTFEHHGLLKARSFLGLTFYLPSSLKTYISQLTADDKKIIAQQIAELSMSPTLLESADNRHTLIITAFKNALPKPSPLLRQGLFPLSSSVRVEEVTADVVETPSSAPPLPSSPEMNTNQFFALMARAPEVSAARPERAPARSATLIRVEEVTADVVETPSSPPPLPSSPEMNTNQFFALMAQAPEAPAARPERTPARRASL
jgi:hypothetical protein